MKRLTKLALCGLLFAVFLSGCSKKEEGTPPSQEEASTEEATSKAPEASQEAVDWGKITKLGEYKGVEVEKMPTEVADEEVEARIQSILDANPEYVAVTGRAAKDGDVVNIDFKGLKDGVAFDGGSSEGYELLIQWKNSGKTWLPTWKKRKRNSPRSSWKTMCCWQW